MKNFTIFMLVGTAVFVVTEKVTTHLLTKVYFKKEKT